MTRLRSRFTEIIGRKSTLILIPDGAFQGGKMRLAILLFGIFPVMSMADPITTLDIYAVYSGMSDVYSFFAVPVGTEPAVMPVTWPGVSGTLTELAGLVESSELSYDLCSGSPATCSTTNADPVLMGPRYFWEIDNGSPLAPLWWSDQTGFVGTPT